MSDEESSTRNRSGSGTNDGEAQDVGDKAKLPFKTSGEDHDGGKATGIQINDNEGHLRIDKKERARERGGGGMIEKS